MAGNSDGLQEMYEYKEMKGKDGYEYVIRGAEVFCGQGSQSCIMQLPKDHGIYSSDGRPLIRNTDIGKENISGFGICKLTGKECIPELEKWTVNTSNWKIDDQNTEEVEYAIERNATATCVHGGIIIFDTSGQTSPSFDNPEFEGAEEILEDKVGNWVRATDRKDFLGHIKVKNAGVYNFGIHPYANIGKENLGSIFLYEKKWLSSNLKFLGSYEIKYHKGQKKEEFLNLKGTTGAKDYEITDISVEYWQNWIDIVLESNKDYYIEIDCPNVDKLYYKLIGNQEITLIDNVKYSSGIWFFNDIFKQRYPNQYASLRLSYAYTKSVGVPIVIMYLSEEYSGILLRMVTRIAANEEDFTGTGSNILSIASFVAGKVGLIKNVKEWVLKLAGIVSDEFAILSLILAFTPKPVIERLRDELARSQDTFVKVMLLDVSPDDDRAIKGKYDIQEFKVEKHPELINKKINIYGEKYLLGGFGLLKKTGDWDELNKGIDEFFKGLEENYGKKFNKTNNTELDSRSTIQVKKLSDNKTKTDNTKSADIKNTTNSNKLADNKNATNNIKLTDIKRKTDNIKLTGSKRKTNNTKLADNKNKSKDRKLVDSKELINNRKLKDRKKKNNNTKDSKNETKNTKSKNNKKQAKK